jgi:hypothetical protein
MSTVCDRLSDKPIAISCDAGVAFVFFRAVMPPQSFPASPGSGRNGNHPGPIRGQKMAVKPKIGTMAHGRGVMSCHNILKTKKKI